MWNNLLHQCHVAWDALLQPCLWRRMRQKLMGTCKCPWGRKRTWSQPSQWKREWRQHFHLELGLFDKQTKRRETEDWSPTPDGFLHQEPPAAKPGIWSAMTSREPFSNISSFFCCWEWSLTSWVSKPAEKNSKKLCRETGVASLSSWVKKCDKFNVMPSLFFLMAWTFKWEWEGAEDDFLSPSYCDSWNKWGLVNTGLGYITTY